MIIITIIITTLVVVVVLHLCCVSAWAAATPIINQHVHAQPAAFLHRRKIGAYVFRVFRVFRVFQVFRCDR